MLKDCNFIKNFIRGAKRGYRGRQNSSRKKKLVEVAENIIKEKVYINKKKTVNNFIHPNINEYVDFSKRSPTDNIYLLQKFPEKIYTLIEAINLHKDVAAPEMYDNLDGLFYVKFLLNMNGIKRNKPIAPFSGIIHYKNLFDFPLKYNNRVLAFAMKPSEQEAANDAGAIISGGKELIKKIIKGVVKRNDFDHVVCTHEILPEVVPLRGILGKHAFPAQSKGSVGPDIAVLVAKFKKSISYQALLIENFIDLSIQMPEDPKYHYVSSVECMLAKISMPLEMIQENYKDLINTLMLHKPSHTKQDDFILKIQLMAPPSREIFQVETQSLENLDIIGDEEKIRDAQN